MEKNSRFTSGNKLDKNARKEGVLGIKILARNIIIHYLGCRYASTKEIHDWLNEELHRVNDLSFRLQ